MLRRTSEKARLQVKWLQKFNEKRPSYKVVFQQKALIMESQELEVAMEGIGS